MYKGDVVQNKCFDELERFISKSRLSTYRHAMDQQNTLKVIGHYIYNTKLSENFYLLLQNFEVTLRNAIYLAYNNKYPEKSFYFLHETDSRNRYLQKKEFHSRECWKMLCGARHKLIKKSSSVNNGKLTAELNFGFWSKLMSTHHANYVTMWHQIFFDVFPHYPYKYPVDKAIVDIENKINKIRRFRNRIFHYEPIFNHENLHAMHKDIIEILGWISPELQKLSLAFDEFDDIVHSKKKINKKLQRLYVTAKKNRDHLKQKKR